MFGKGSKLYSIFKMKCPSCHEGDFFKTKGAYNLKKVADMHERCPVCNQTYEPEPNFYYGSMYMSYAITVTIFIAVMVLVTGILGYSFWVALGVLTLVLLVGWPYLFRLSRVAWLNVFVKYKKR